MPRKLTDVPEVSDWVNSTTAAEMLGISRQSINKLINNGRFETLHTIGRVYVMKRHEVEKLVDEKAKAQEEATAVA